MKKIIIGLTGEIGAGKDTFCDHVIKVSQGPVFCLKFSQPLSEVLKIFFDEVTRNDQQWLGVVLRERFGEDILAKALLKKINSIDKGIILLNGIRYWQEYNMVKDLDGTMIYITADSKLRWQRLQNRGEKKDDSAPYEKFLELEKAVTESLIQEMGKKADLKIENNGSLEEFHKKTDNLIKDLNKN